MRLWLKFGPKKSQVTIDFIVFKSTIVFMKIIEKRVDEKI
jgi:hypothetical protein